MPYVFVKDQPWYFRRVQGQLTRKDWAESRAAVASMAVEMFGIAAFGDRDLVQDEVDSFLARFDRSSTVRELFDWDITLEQLIDLLEILVYAWGDSLFHRRARLSARELDKQSSLPKTGLQERLNVLERAAAIVGSVGPYFQPRLEQELLSLAERARSELGHREWTEEARNSRRRGPPKKPRRHLAEASDRILTNMAPAERVRFAARLYCDFFEPEPVAPGRVSDVARQMRALLKPLRRMRRWAPEQQQPGPRGS